MVKNNYVNYENIAIALSGGAVRASAHIGVLKALEEFGIKPNVLSGSSAGSIIAVFYAAGYTPQEMEDLLLKTKFFDYISFRFPKVAFFSLEKMDIFFEKYLGIKDLNKLKKKTYISVVNLQEGAVEYVDEGDLSLYVRASCSLPILFEPTYIGGVPYIDGGIMDNLPIDPFLNYKNIYIIGSEVNPIVKRIRKINIFSLAIRTLFLSIRANTEKNKNYCDLFIQPVDLVRVGLFETKKLREAIDIGYFYTKRLLWEKFR